MGLVATWSVALQGPLPDERGAHRTTVGFLRAFAWYRVVLAAVGTGILFASLLLMFLGAAPLDAFGDITVWIMGVAFVAVLVSFLGLGGAFLALRGRREARDRFGPPVSR